MLDHSNFIVFGSILPTQTVRGRKNMKLGSNSGPLTPRAPALSIRLRPLRQEPEFFYSEVLRSITCANNAGPKEYLNKFKASFKSLTF